MKISAIAPFGLRMPPDVKSWVSDLAQANDRSMNMEIVRILRERMQTTAGKSLLATPAVVPERDALPGGSSTHAR